MSGLGSTCFLAGRFFTFFAIFQDNKPDRFLSNQSHGITKQFLSLVFFYLLLTPNLIPAEKSGSSRKYQNHNMPKLSMTGRRTMNDWSNRVRTIVYKKKK